MINKHLKIIVLFFGLNNLNSLAQQGPTNNNPSGVPSGTDDKQF